MKYFLTGISGFACPHLARLLLSDGHEVHALIRGSNGCEYDLLDFLVPEEIEKINFHYGDLKDYQSLLKIFHDFKFDGVFHLAAQSHPPTSFKDPVGTMETNVMGTVYLVDLITRYQPDCVFQFVSTSEVYGDTCKKIGILREDIPLTPSNPYGVSKVTMDLYVQERCQNGFLKGYITRAFSHTGPRRGKNFSISWDAYHLAIMKARRDKKLEAGQRIPKNTKYILPVGNLKTKRIVIDVNDCVRAYYELMKKHHEYDGKKKNPINGEAFNICGDIKSVKEMEYFTNKLIEISGLKNVKKKMDERVYRPIDIEIQVGDTKKLRRLTGWKPKISIDTTLKALFDYWYNKVK